MAKEESKTQTTTTSTTRAAQQRVRMDTSNMKSAYSNFFVAQDNVSEVVLSFGYNQSLGATQQELNVQMLHQVILHPVTARRVKDTLVALFQKRDAPRTRVAASPAAPTKKVG